MYRVLNVTDDRTHCGHMGHVVPDLERACALAAAHGFHGVNVDLSGCDDADVDRIEALLSAHGVRATAFGFEVALDGDEAAFRASLERFAREAAWARRLGCLVSLAYVPPFSTDGFAVTFRRWCARLAEVRPILVETGVRIGFEFIGPTETRAHTPHDFIHTMDGVRCLLAATDLDELAGFKLDTHHWQTSGGGLLDLAHVPLDQVLYVELNDGLPGHTRFTSPEFERELPLRTGVTNLSGFLGQLVARGYDGPIAVEPWSTRIRELPLDDAVAELRDALDLCEALMAYLGSRR